MPEPLHRGRAVLSSVSRANSKQIARRTCSGVPTCEASTFAAVPSVSCTMARSKRVGEISPLPEAAASSAARRRIRINLSEGGVSVSIEITADSGRAWRSASTALATSVFRTCSAERTAADLDFKRASSRCSGSISGWCR